MAAQLLNDYQKALIKNKTTDKGISIYRLAHICKITPSSMYQLLKGLTPLYPRWKRALSDVLNISDEEWNQGIVYTSVSDDGGDADE